MELVIAIVQQLYKKKIKITMTIGFSVKAVAQSSLCHKIVQTCGKNVSSQMQNLLFSPTKSEKNTD